MWISIVVPPAVLVLAVLLQHLEARVLTVPDSAGRPAGPRSADPTDPDPATLEAAAMDVTLDTEGADPAALDTTVDPGRDAGAPRRAALALVPPAREDPSPALRASGRQRRLPGRTRHATA